jgi:hypothetical protein
MARKMGVDPGPLSGWKRKARDIDRRLDLLRAAEESAPGATEHPDSSHPVHIPLGTRGHPAENQHGEGPTRSTTG